MDDARESTANTRPDGVGGPASSDGLDGPDNPDNPGNPEILAEERRRRYERGLPWVKAVVGEPGLAAISSVSQVAPEMEQWIVAFGFGDVYSRPALPPRDRQLLTMATLTALGGCEPQLKLHIKAALNVGVTPEEVVETFMHAAGYCGFPRAMNALGVAREVFDELGVVPPKE